MTKTKTQMAQEIYIKLKELEQQINDAITAGLTVNIKAPTGFENSNGNGYHFDVEISEKITY